MLAGGYPIVVRVPRRRGGSWSRSKAIGSKRCTRSHWRGPDWHDTGLVFTKPDGSPLEGTTVSRMFHRHLEAAGLPQRRFHDYADLLVMPTSGPKAP